MAKRLKLFSINLGHIRGVCEREIVESFLSYLLEHVGKTHLTSFVNSLKQNVDDRSLNTIPAGSSRVLVFLFNWLGQEATH